MIDVWAVWTIIGLLSGILATLLYIAYAGNRKAGTGLPSWVVREPLRIRAAAVAIIGAIATLAASLGYDIDPEVQAAVIGVIGVTAWAISYLARPHVTPVADPRISDAS